jgi:hypothetical protein
MTVGVKIKNKKRSAVLNANATSRRFLLPKECEAKAVYKVLRVSN